MKEVAAMMNLIQRFLSKDRTNKSVLRNNFKTYFFSQPEHQWIATSNARGHFDELFSRLPSGVLDAMMTKYPVSFIPSSALRARSSQNSFGNTIVVFPEFQKLVEGSKKSAVAYLAHELAFVLYELEQYKQDPLMAEVAADKFVCDLGLMFELEELLLMLDETVEKRLRLTYLTAHHFSGSNN
jgi:hypothetical protein